MTALTLNVFSKSLLSLLRNFGSVETAAGFYAFFSNAVPVLFPRSFQMLDLPVHLQRRANKCWCSLCLRVIFLIMVLQLELMERLGLYEDTFWEEVQHIVFGNVAKNLGLVAALYFN